MLPRGRLPHHHRHHHHHHLLRYHRHLHHWRTYGKKQERVWILEKRSRKKENALGLQESPSEELHQQRKRDWRAPEHCTGQRGLWQL
jgi:hypothetical protein